jgi:hypothetical protein
MMIIILSPMALSASQNKKACSLTYTITIPAFFLGCRFLILKNEI